MRVTHVTSQDVFREWLEVEHLFARRAGGSKNLFCSVLRSDRTRRGRSPGAGGICCSEQLHPRDRTAKNSRSNAGKIAAKVKTTNKPSACLFGNALGSDRGLANARSGRNRAHIRSNSRSFYLAFRRRKLTPLPNAQAFLYPCKVLWHDPPNHRLSRPSRARVQEPTMQLLPARLRRYLG